MCSLTNLFTAESFRVSPPPPPLPLPSCLCHLLQCQLLCTSSCWCASQCATFTGVAFCRASFSTAAFLLALTAAFTTVASTVVGIQHHYSPFSQGEVSLLPPTPTDRKQIKAPNEQYCPQMLCKAELSSFFLF